MTALATYTPPGPWPAGFDSDLQLGRSEPLAVGIKRVSMEQFEHAASRYYDGEEQLGTAIHETRKVVKRVRALLRLVRDELADRVYRYEDTSLRDTGRMLSKVRSATAMLSAVELIRDLYGDFLAPETFSEMIVKLRRRRDLAHIETLEDPNLIGRVVRSFERAHARYAAWPTDPEAREVYGSGIRDSFDSIEGGLTSTYSRGRKDMVTAYAQPSALHFHEWRKRAKYLRHQMEFLAQLWPEVIAGTAVTLDRLGDLLGEEHDHSELMGLLRDRPDLCPDGRERSLFAALATQRRSELRVAAEIVGRRVYAEKPTAMRSRFSEYWEARLLVSRSPLDTLVVY